jgi:hypothetical protein
MAGLRYYDNPLSREPLVAGIKGRRMGVVVYAPNGAVEGTVATVVDGMVEFTESQGGFVPTYIGPSETFTIPANKQALYASTIDNEGILDVVGSLIEVD